MAETQVTAQLLREWPLPDPGDKEQRGRVVVLGGSDRTPGGALLACEAALRSGAGKVQLVTTEAVAVPCAVALPEALVVGTAAEDGHLGDEGAGRAAELAADADCLLIGPGLDDVGSATSLVAATVAALRGGVPVVLDALAMAFVTATPGGLHGRSAVLTPNSTELAIALGADERQAERHRTGLDDVRRLATRTHAVVCSGDATSWVARPDGRAWRADGGGPGLGTAGSGDVLAGLVAGLTARCDRPDQAAVWAVQLHKRAGELAAEALGGVGFLARDACAQVPRALAELGG